MERPIPCAAAGHEEVSQPRDELAGFAPREILLAAAARAVLAAFREPLARHSLPTPAAATLRLLETALDLYQLDPPK